MRQCGDCSLCCKLLPLSNNKLYMSDVLFQMRNPHAMSVFHKPAGQRCEHQRRTGCAVYNKRPACCRAWSCAWLDELDTAELSRPDRSHYVIDTAPDFVTQTNNETGETKQIEVVQIWCDPQHRNAWQEPRLMAFIERRSKQGIAALIRFNSSAAISVFAPDLSPTGEWAAVESGMVAKQHSFAEIAAVIGGQP
jgi:hypothetical protein